MTPAAAWGGAALIGVPLASAVLVTGAVDILSATGYFSAARSIGWGGATIARRMFQTENLPATVGAQTATSTARDALAASPLVPGALRILAQVHSATGDRRRAGALLDAAAGLGWRDATTQRHLYGAAVASQRYDVALRHADAVIRLQVDREVLLADIVGRLDKPAFRRAFARQSATSRRWGDYILQENWHRLSPGTLRAYLHDRAVAGRPVARVELGPTLGAMARRGRLLEAHQLWEISFNAQPQGGMRRLPWPDRAASEHPTPFDWSLPPAYAVAADDAGSVLTFFGGGESDSDESWPTRTLVVPSGSYHLRAARGDAVPWRWSAACNADPPRPMRRFSDAQIDVPSTCSFVRLAIRAFDVGATEVKLGELQLVALEPSR